MKGFWEDGNWGAKQLSAQGALSAVPPELIEVIVAEDDWQSLNHKGPCCGSCDWEWAYTDIGMRNFGFGCCCRTKEYDSD